MIEYEGYMDIAIQEAKESLKEGNSGYGVVIGLNGQIISRAHDTAKTDGDPTAHASVNITIKIANEKKIDFSKCVLIATHEPCQMCLTAIASSGIRTVGFGHSAKTVSRQKDPSGRGAFKQPEIQIIEGIKSKECSLFYLKSVRDEVTKLRNVTPKKLDQMAAELTRKREEWFLSHYSDYRQARGLEAGYELFLRKLSITTEEAPVVSEDEKQWVIHSKNFCPTLEACKILDLDTRTICKALNEAPTDDLLKLFNPHLSFSRNYDKLRPYTPFCEEIISLEK